MRSQNSLFRKKSAVGPARLWLHFTDKRRSLRPSSCPHLPSWEVKCDSQVLDFGNLTEIQHVLSSHILTWAVVLLALSGGISAVNGSDSNDPTPIPAILRYLAFLSYGFLLSKSARLNWKLPRIIFFGNYIRASRVYLSFHPRSSHFLRSAEQVMWQSSVYLHPFLFKNIICITNCTNSCM